MLAGGRRRRNVRGGGVVASVPSCSVVENERVVTPLPAF